MPIDDEAANEAIFSARSSGRSILVIAHEFGLSEDAVRSTVAEMVARTYDGSAMREDIALENHRLRALSLKYYGLAMDGEGDRQAAVIYLKSSERRMVMLGGNAPQAYSVHLSNQAAPEQKTSTQKLEAALDRLRFVSPRQRELSDRAKYGDGPPLSEAEVAERTSPRKATVRPLNRRANYSQVGPNRACVRPHR